MVLPSSGSRLSGIEGLRGFAAFSVLCFHVMLVLRANDQVRLSVDPLAGLFAHGLTLFFVLSGFLLYRPYVQAVLRDRPLPQPGEFLRNRALRIWPAYLVILLIVGFVLGLARIDAYSSGSMDAQAAALGRFDNLWMFLANALLVQGWVPDYMQTGLVVSWSLVAEVSFYLLLPPLGFLAARLARHAPRLLAAIVPVLLLGMVGLLGRFTTLYYALQQPVADRTDFVAGPTWSAVVYRGILGQGDLFAAGMAAAVLVVAVQSSSARGLRMGAWLVMAAVSVCAVFVGGGEFAMPFVGLFFAGGIALLQLPAPSVPLRSLTRFLELAPIKAAGLCSYSVYLWHCTPIWLLRLHTDVRFSTPTQLLGCIAIVAVATYVLSWITYRWVELPFMERKHATERTSPEPAVSAT